MHREKLGMKMIDAKPLEQKPGATNIVKCFIETTSNLFCSHHKTRHDFFWYFKDIA